MPTYEYACTGCGNEWEAEQSIKDAPLIACPKCAQNTAKRQISRGSGFILKGGGWYSDLYSSAGNKKAESPSKETKTESKSGGGGSNDSGASGGGTSGGGSSGGGGSSASGSASSAAA
jgi:putative FmdB family regulatory protein